MLENLICFVAMPWLYWEIQPEGQAWLRLQGERGGGEQRVMKAEDETEDPAQMSC